MKIGKDVRNKLDQMLEDPKNINSIELYKATRLYLVFCSGNGDEREFERLEKLARILILSLDHENPKKSYVGVALNKEFALPWISHMKTLLGENF